MSILTSIANKFKKPISVWLEGAVAKFVNDYGKIENLNVDFAKKSITALLLLKGEDEVITIDIEGVGVIEEEGRNYLTFKSVKVSREWIDNLAQAYLPTIMEKNPIEVPDSFAWALKMII